MKQQIRYRCAQCGHSQPKWMGRCPSCGEWNSLQEISESPTTRTGLGGDREPSQPISLRDIDDSLTERRSTGSQEFDRVLGGGLITGSSVLIGGEPGIGKSTLMLQTAIALSDTPTLYVSGEESAPQIRSRAARIGRTDAPIDVLCTDDLQTLLSALRNTPPTTLIVDSVQTLCNREIGPVPGTPGQVRYCCGALIDWARRSNAVIFFIAHVTKEGAIAGPKVMEHMVDTVLYFEQSGDIRFLRATKNRFGVTDEIGLFEMTSAGLWQVENVASLFLVERTGELPPGVIATPIYEGSRVFMVELQALTVDAKGGVSRVFSDCIDARRVSRVAAVLERHAGASFSDQDIYVNVAGGIRIAEVGVELPLAYVLYSARRNRPLPEKLAITGEVSLAGEIRPVPQLRRRLKAARDLGYQRCIGPVQTGGGEESSETWEQVSSIAEGIGLIFHPKSAQ